MPYTPPQTNESNEANAAAYLYGHEGGWDHANYVAAYGDPEPVHAVAYRFAEVRFKYPHRTFLRAREGFLDGVKAFEDAARPA
jgi:hypothetical protein